MRNTVARRWRWLARYPRVGVGALVLAPFAVFAVIPGRVAPHPPNELSGAPFQPPSRTYWLGTDEVGRDVLSRLIWAAHTDLKISLASTLVAAVIGISIGLVAGHRGGFADGVVLRITDVMLAFPSILLAIFLVAAFGSGDTTLILALALLFVPGFVRLTRGLAIALRHRAFVESSLISGASSRYIILRHLLPNAAGPLLVGVALTASYALLAAATLSYLGLGTPIPTPSWGNMLQSAFDWLFLDWRLGVFPGVCIILVALGYSTLAAGIEDVLRRNGRVTRREARGSGEAAVVSPAPELGAP